MTKSRNLHRLQLADLGQGIPKACLVIGDVASLLSLWHRRSSAVSGQPTAPPSVGDVSEGRARIVDLPLAWAELRPRRALRPGDELPLPYAPASRREPPSDVRLYLFFLSSLLLAAGPPAGLLRSSSRPLGGRACPLCGGGRGPLGAEAARTCSLTAIPAQLFAASQPPESRTPEPVRGAFSKSARLPE
jgi:hypothetical protein